MRDILFRGKQLNTEEWIEGYLVKALWNEAYVYIGYVFDDEQKDFDFVKIDPTTVGQYTGLKDKNGVKIYEGDILESIEYPFSKDGQVNYYAVVIWFDNSPAFGLLTKVSDKSEVIGISDGNTEYIEDFESKYYKVVGNIYDNSELLRDKV